MFKLNSVFVRYSINSTRFSPESFSSVIQSKCYNNVLREYSARPPPPQKATSFIGKIIENYKEEASKNKKLKQSIKEFRADMDNFEKSDALKRAREKYKFVEEETAEGTQKAKQQIDAITKKIQEAEIMQKASNKANQVTEEASKQAMKVSQSITQKGEELAKTQTYKTISSTAQKVKKEIDNIPLRQGTMVYKAPEVLKLRVERDLQAEAKIIEANTKATGMVMHKDSKFSQNWENFKNNNPAYNKILELRTKLDESNNPIIRASMLVKDKATELFGGVFQQTELSETLTEICKMDPQFDKERFVLECEFFIIPNLLEAMIRPDLEILEDWCFERAYKTIASQFEQAKNLGYTIEAKVLDVDQVDLVMGKVMDEGPILAVSFQSQQLCCVRDSNKEIVEGSPDKVLRINNIWILCRDQTELNAHAAWRLLEHSSQSTEQFV